MEMNNFPTEPAIKKHDCSCPACGRRFAVVCDITRVREDMNQSNSEAGEKKGRKDELPK